MSLFWQSVGEKNMLGIVPGFWLGLSHFWMSKINLLEDGSTSVRHTWSSAKKSLYKWEWNKPFMTDGLLGLPHSFPDSTLLFVHFCALLHVDVKVSCLRMAAALMRHRIPTPLGLRAEASYPPVTPCWTNFKKKQYTSGNLRKNLALIELHCRNGVQLIHLKSSGFQNILK